MTSPLVAVASTKFARGVASSADDWRDAKNARHVGATYDVVELGDALEREWRTDAHLVSYIVRDAAGVPLAKQPRINKSGLAFVESLGCSVECGVFFADVDNPEHADWTPALFDAFVEHIAKASVLATTGVYLTQHGARLYQPLARSIPVREVEPYLTRWLAQLVEAGIAADGSCRDWTRHFRLPHVRRNGKAYRSPFLDTARARAIDLPALPANDAKPEQIRRRRERTSVAPATAATDETPLVRAFAAAGMLGPSRAPGRTTVQCPWEALHTIGDRFDSSTIVFSATPARPRGWFHCSHGHCSTRTQREVLEALPAEARAIIETPATDDPPVSRRTTPSDAFAAMCDAIRGANALELVAAECGIGKSEALRTVAAERAQREHPPRRDGTAAPTRAPMHSKTGISVYSHELAAEYAAIMRERHGLSVLRIAGPLAFRDERGEPVCKYHATGAHLANGGQSVRWELCEGRGREKCAYYDTCTARTGAVGSTDARVVVGPHQLIGEIAGAIGSTGLLGVDEPGALASTEAFAEGELAHALASYGYFGRRYAVAMRPAVSALAAWLRAAELEETAAVLDAIRHAADDIDGSALDRAIDETGVEPTGETWRDVVACARAAHYPDHKGTAPPIQPPHIARAKLDPAFAEIIGRASRVLGAVHRAIGAESGAQVRADEAKAERVIFITSENESLSRALRREGPTVVLDANGRLRLAELARIVGYEPVLHEFSAADGARVERTWIQTHGATRTGWIAHGRAQVETIVGAVRAMVEWVREAPCKKLVIVTFAAIERLLVQALRPTEKTPARVRERLVPLLATLDCEVVLAHYHAIRGRNDLRDADALVTLGDPRPHKGQVENDAAFFGIQDARTRADELARAELEQAHGRLRTVQRTTFARALHIGALVPSGSAWTSGVETRQMAGGGTPRASAMPVAEVARAVEHLGGTKAAAAALGCSERAMRRYLAGSRAVAGAEAEALRAAIAVPVRFGDEVSPAPKRTGTSRSISSIEECRSAVAGDMAIGLPVRLSPATPGDAPEAAPLVAELGGARSAARLLGLHHETVARYVRGERTAPSDVVERLRGLVAARAPVGPDDDPSGGGAAPPSPGRGNAGVGAGAGSTAPPRSTDLTARLQEAA